MNGSALAIGAAFVVFLGGCNGSAGDKTTIGENKPPEGSAPAIAVVDGTEDNTAAAGEGARQTEPKTSETTEMAKRADSAARETLGPTAKAVVQNAASNAPEGAEITTESGLKYIDVTVGNGPSPQRGQTVVVHFTGWLTNGKKFRSSLDENHPFEFPLGFGWVIKGWEEGVATMKVGGKRKLIIPPELGFGQRGVPPDIRPGATLVYEVELLELR